MFSEYYSLFYDGKFEADETLLILDDSKNVLKIHADLTANTEISVACENNNDNVFAKKVNNILIMSFGNECCTRK